MNLTESVNESTTTTTRINNSQSTKHFFSMDTVKLHCGHSNLDHPLTNACLGQLFLFILIIFLNCLQALDDSVQVSKSAIMQVEGFAGIVFLGY